LQICVGSKKTVVVKYAFIIALALMASPATAYVLGGKIEQQNGDGKFEKLEVEPIRVDIGGKDGFISAGNIVASHYVFFDSLNGYHSGYVDFDAPILGVAAYQASMGATDFLAKGVHREISRSLGSPRHIIFNLMLIADGMIISSKGSVVIFIPFHVPNICTTLSPLIPATHSNSDNPLTLDQKCC